MGNTLHTILAFLALVLIYSCGVAGPPSPLFPDTPQDSDLPEKRVLQSPSPFLSSAPSSAPSISHNKKNRKKIKK
ncbi:MAG: hypothetical protein HY072_00090 [Deltaproteobacteria bacterium]|nr:hypothetical protein [Deltaproteobacteria bacterium]